MRRYALGFIAGFLLLIGAITTISRPHDASAIAFAGPCVKAGLVLGALWLAMPQLQRMATGLPRWLLGWFVKTDSNGKTDKLPPAKRSSSAKSPVPQQPRPRRRSNS